MNWIFGIVMVSLYTIIFFKVKLYADMCFQLIALGMQFYGLYNWCSKKQKENPIKKNTQQNIFNAIGASFFLFVPFGFILKHYTDSTTIFMDAFITSTSLVALFMQANKWIEHWLFWICIDIFSIELYFTKNLYFTCGLYFLFILLSVIGYQNWQKKLKAA